MTHRGGEVLRWSTEAFPQRDRLDCYIDLLCKQLLNVTTSTSERDTFHAEVEIAQQGPLVVATIAGSAQDSFRTLADVARTTEHAFDLVMGLNCSWNWMTARSRVGLQPRDVVLTDTRLVESFHWPADCAARTFRIPMDQLPTWVPEPDRLVGQRIDATSPWGHALSHFLGQISPQSAMNLPLPAQVVSDHVCALLMLAATQIVGSIQSPRSRYSDLQRQIVECITERCTDPQLSARQVAESLNISSRTLHRCLGARGRTFGALLLDARTERAAGMIKSRSFDRLTIAELGRRAGFSDASHFARAFRKRLGMSPGEMRRAR
jgi:AraC family transcriptional regulator, positive regulator of tynA and feaB